MKYGYFDDSSREYVITTPKTPLPWINYLGCEDFFSIKSNTSGGYCFYKDAKLLRLTRYRYNNVPFDDGGHYFYIKDGDTVWNPGWQPVQTELDSYECRHGMGYSIFTGVKNGLKAQVTSFVPMGYTCEVNKLTLTNESDTVKNFSVFSYVEFCLWNAMDDMTNFQRNFSTGEVEVMGSVIIHKTEYRERRRHYAIFGVNTPIDGFDTDRDSFLGAYRGYHNPQVVEDGKSKNSMASGWAPIGSHQITLSLQPGESFQTSGPSEGPVAESVFIAGMFVKYGKEYAELCRRQGLTDEAAKADAEVADMYQTILTAGWDGEWFVRAYDAYENKVGSHECEDGKIFIEPQGFCVLAGVGIKEGHANKALASVEKILDTKYGIVLLQPAYKDYHLELGEVSSYPPGYKENAGIFCHNNPWISIAETCVGHGNRAFDVYRKICPAYIENISEIHRTEPYVYSQMIAGKDAKNFGEAKNSWLTGTAAWTFLNVSQAILGIQPDYDGLVVDPCIPSELSGFTITRKFRDVTYTIEVQNPNKSQKGISKLIVDGVTVDGNQIPYDASKKQVHVVAVLDA